MAKTTKKNRASSINRGRTDEWIPKFLAEFQKRANINDACRAIQLHRTTIWARRQNDPEFAAKYEEAREVARDVIRAEYHRRAVEGTREYLYTKSGAPIYEPLPDGAPADSPRQHAYITNYSDTLMVRLGAAHCPEFADKAKVEITGADGGPVKTEVNHKVEFDHDEFTKRFEQFAGNVGGRLTLPNGN